MKWYSVKEHQPVLTICCVLLAIHVQETGGIYLTLGEWDNGWKDWETKFDIEKELLGHKVLYFCYPDPIPKAYENLIEANKIVDSSNDNPLMNILIEDFYYIDQFEKANYFTIRAVNCLRAEGIKTMGQLLSFCEHQLMKIPNLGKKSICEINDVLKKCFLKLGENDSYRLENGYSKCFDCRHKKLIREAGR